jgi:hypothetical protein
LRFPASECDRIPSRYRKNMRRHAFIPQRGFDNHSRRWSIGPRE